MQFFFLSKMDVLHVHECNSRRFQKLLEISSQLFIIRTIVTKHMLFFMQLNNQQKKKKKKNS